MFSNFFMQCAIHGGGVNSYQPLQLVPSIRNMAAVGSVIFRACPSSRSIVITDMGHDDTTFDRSLTWKSS
jgi:hypothetical protein